MTTRSFSAVLLLLVGLALPGCGGETSEPSGPAETAAAASAPAANTPEEAFAAFVEATQKNDMPTVVSLLSPESQGMMTIGLVMSASFMTVGDEGKEKSLDTLMRKHISDWDDASDPTDEGAGPEAILESIADLPGFVRELSAWMAANGDDESGFQVLGELGEVTVAGDRATAQVQTEDGPQPVEFRNIDGQWRIHMPGPEEGMAGGAPAPVADDGTPGLGALWIDDRPYKLRDVVAYRTTFFDDPVTVLLFTERKVTDGQLGKLKTMLAAGGDDEFFISGPNLKLTVGESGELVSLFAWAENLSINGSEGAQLTMTRSGDRLRGTAAMAEPGEIFDSTYRFEVEFDTELVSAR
jgi:hypothetical protein